MADPITIKDIVDTPIVPYEAVRHNIQTGDIVFCSGTYFFSNVIRWFTKSTWSHVGVIYRDDHLQRVFILESETLIGVRVVPLSKYLKDYHGRRKPYKGRMMVGRVFPEMDAESLKKGINFCVNELTKPYDNMEILFIALRILFKRGKHSRDRKYICSELVDECYRKAGVQFKLKDSVSPDDIWQHPSIKPVCRLM